MDYVAIDFETANERIASPCALGLAVVSGGRVVERRSWLIRPKELYFNPFNIYVHGIKPRDVKNEPEFYELWPVIREYVDGNMVVAHNASFDVGVLTATLDLYGLPQPELDYACTVMLARRVWPDLHRYRLNVVARHLGVQFKHHDAADDAYASAQIVVAACREIGVGSIDQLLARLGVGHGSVKSGHHRIARANPSGLVPMVTDFDPDHPLYRRVIAFTGSLAEMTRKEAMQCVIDVGGICANRVTHDTDFLVLGAKGKPEPGRNGRTDKLKRAEWLISKGFPVEIIKESDFLELLDT